MADDRLDTDGKYSWLKSPRYDGLAMEVGPLSRMLVAYGSGHPRVRELVGYVLGELGVGPAALFSTLGRVAARGIETLVLAEKLEGWLDELTDNMGRGELAIHDNSKWDPSSWPEDCAGAGFHEAPRGALGHWVHIVDGEIANYQCVVPSTWNFCPRDSQGQPGPVEQALEGTKIKDESNPFEIVRIVRSYDPCLACAIHLVTPKGRDLGRFQVC